MAYLYEVVLTAQYFNQQIINVWNYINPVFAPANDPTAQELLSLLGWSEWEGDPTFAYPAGTVAEALMNAVNPSFQMESVTVRNIYSTTDIAEWVFPPSVSGQSTGLLAGEACSPAVAIGFNTNRVRTDIGRGQKRFSGVTESVIDAGGVLDASAVEDFYTPLAAAMSAALPNVLPAVGEFIPAIFSKLKYEVEVDGVPTGRFAYKYWATAEAQEARAAIGISWAVKSRQRFQVSRQYGKGR